MASRLQRVRRRRPPILVLGILVGLAGLQGLAGCQAPIAPPEATPPDEDPVSDHEGPELNTVPITVPQSLSEPIRIEATASDPSGIYTVLLHYKPQNTEWEILRMDESESGEYFVADLTAEMVQGASSVSYYLEAADGTPYHNTSFSPSTGEENPYRFNLVY